MGRPTLVVMAAGIGSRYGGLKQVDPVGPGGERIIDYSIYDALRAGFGRVVFVIRREMETEFRREIGRFAEERVETLYVFQELDLLPPGFPVPEGRAKPWGTGHAVLACREAVETPFAVINGDDFYGAEAFVLLYGHLTRVPPTSLDFCLVGYRLGNTLSEHGHVSRGVCEVNPDGTLRRITEHTRIERHGNRIRGAAGEGEWLELAPETVVSMNTWGFTPALFPELEAGFVKFLEARGADPKSEYFLPERIGELVAEGRAVVRVLPTGEGWFGITYRQDKPRVQRALRDLVERGVYPSSVRSAPVGPRNP